MVEIGGYVYTAIEYHLGLIGDSPLIEDMIPTNTVNQRYQQARQQLISHAVLTYRSIQYPMTGVRANCPSCGNAYINLFATEGYTPNRCTPCQRVEFDYSLYDEDEFDLGQALEDEAEAWDRFGDLEGV